jgi:hypothetical protein
MGCIEIYLRTALAVLNPATLTLLEAHKAHSEEVGVLHHGLDRRAFEPMVRRDAGRRVPDSPQSSFKRDDEHLEQV